VASLSAVSSSFDFTSARLNMVQCQLNPSGIITESVLTAYNTVPRELFVPESLAGICYQDECLRVGTRRLLNPLAHALMMEHVGFNGTEHALDIGGLTGYSAAIMRHLCASVIALDEDAGALAQAQHAWETLKLDSITAVLGDHAQGASAQGPYDVIVINGAVVDVPKALFEQLKPNGKLVCIKGHMSGVGKITLYQRDSSGLDEKVYQDMFADYLLGFAPRQTFTF
jgi:protein-L-isoaspartate(D-aspartate) O-methyltransferase